MAIEDNGLNNSCKLFIELVQARLSGEISEPEKLPELPSTYIDVPLPAYNEPTQTTTSQTASLTGDDTFETTAEVAYSDRSARPSLIGERPLETRDYLFMLAAYFCTFWCLGFINTLGVLGVELLESFPDSKVIILMIPAIGCGLAYAPGLLIGFLINKFGCPVVIIAGGFLQGSAILMSVFGNHAMFLLFSIGVLLGMSTCFVSVTNSVFVGIYFGNRASVFLSILSTAGPTGAVIFPFLINICIEQYGWRGCLLIFSGVYFNIIPCGMYLWFCQKKAQNMATNNAVQLPENINTPKRLFDTSVFRNLLFTVFLFAMSSITGYINLIMASLPMYLVFNGFNLSMSALGYSIMSIVSIPPRIIMGIILRLTGWPFVYFYIVLSISVALMIFIMMGITGFTSLIFCCVMLGLLYGCPIGLYSLVVLEFIGSQKYSSAMGISETTNGIMIICQGLISGVLVNLSGSYQLSFYSFGAISICTNLVMAASLAREYIKRKQFDFRLFSKK